MLPKTLIAGLAAGLFAFASFLAHAQTPMGQVPVQRPGAPPAVSPGAQPAPPGTPQQPAHGTPAQPSQRPGVPGPVLKIEQMTEAQFTALPDNAIIEVAGQHMTKKAFVDDFTQRSRAAVATAQAQASQAHARFLSKRAQVLKRQKEDLDANNARVRSELARLRAAGTTDTSPKLEAIRKEAGDLKARSTTATPAEQAEIDKRAGELLRQLEQLRR